VSGDAFLPITFGDDEVEETVNGAVPVEADVGETNVLSEVSFDCEIKLAGVTEGGGKGEVDEKNNSNEFVGDETPWLECTEPNEGLLWAENKLRLPPNSTVSDEETFSKLADFGAWDRPSDEGGVRAGDLDTGCCVCCCCCCFSLGLGTFVGEENEFCTWISVPNVLETCCWSEFEAFLCMPNIVNANWVPIGGVDVFDDDGGGGGVGCGVLTLDVVGDGCCLWRCKSRFDEMIDFISRVDAFPFRSLVFSINRTTVCVEMIESDWPVVALKNSLLRVLTNAYVWSWRQKR
jgi:hypothetical protein